MSLHVTNPCTVYCSGSKIYIVIYVVAMLGGLHIEMAIEEVIGDLLEGSGWFGIFVERGVTKSGHAEGFLTAKNVKK